MILYFFLLLYPSIYHSYSEYSEYEIWQEPLKTAVVGDSTNLACICLKQRTTSMFWIRQKLGEKPLVIATSYQAQPAEFQNGFDKSGRFNARNGPISFNLSISNTELSDSATYYCAVTFLYELTFGGGTVLIVKDQALKSNTLLQQKKVQIVHPGDNVILQCRVLSQSCAGEHSVYWLRHGESGQSHPAAIYTHRDNSGQCMNPSKADSSTQSCVYNLHMNNLSTTDVGIYYCAVAACGEIMFGNGTSLNIKDKDFQIKWLVLLSIIRSAVLLFTFTAFLLYTLRSC